MIEKDQVIKPKLNSYVWVKSEIGYDTCFSRVQVIAKGKDLFVHENSFSDDYIEEFRQPLYYNNYKDTWFKSLKEIREKYAIKKIKDDYYESKGISEWYI